MLENKHIKVLEPPKYQAKREARKIRNFLWCMETIFKALHIEDDASKINTATLYLIEDVVLWWRRREEDVKKGTCSIAKWDEFKASLRGNSNSRTSRKWP